MWGIRCEFFKVGSANNEHPLGHNPLPGATFILQRQMPDGLGGTHWVQVAPPTVGQYLHSTDANDATRGRVFIDAGEGAGFSPLLEWPRNWPRGANELLNENAVFRLIEVTAPTGYQRPGGHWTITFNAGLGMPVFSAHGNNPNMTTVTVATGDLEGRRHLVHNRPYEFYFWKTSELGTRLAGAQFRLFVYNGTSAPTTTSTILPGMIGNGANQWTEIATGTSSLTVPMTFPLRPGRFYQLVEILAPPGFQTPFGEWRLTVNSSDYPSKPYATLNRSIVGGSAPNIVPCTVPAPRTYLIHNRSDFELPLTGGPGVMLFVISGMTLILAAGIAMIVFKRKRMTVPVK